MSCKYLLETEKKNNNKTTIFRHEWFLSIYISFCLPMMHNNDAKEKRLCFAWTKPTKKENNWYMTVCLRQHMLSDSNEKGVYISDTTRGEICEYFLDSLWEMMYSMCWEGFIFCLYKWQIDTFVIFILHICMIQTNCHFDLLLMAFWLW